MAAKKKRKKKPYVDYSLRIPNPLYARICAEAAKRSKTGVYTSGAAVMLEAFVLHLDKLEGSSAGPLHRVQKAA